MVLKHSIFVFYTFITNEFEHLLKHFLKSNKIGPTKECQHNLHKTFWVKIQGRITIFILYISIDIRVFLQVIRRKPENFEKKCKNKTCKREKVVPSSKHCICHQKLYCIVNI